MITKRSLATVLLVVGFLLSGCKARSDPAISIAGIHPGQTRSDVTRLLGKPATQPSTEAESYYPVAGVENPLMIEFTASGRVKKVVGGLLQTEQGVLKEQEANSERVKSMLGEPTSIRTEQVDSDISLTLTVFSYKTPDDGDLQIFLTEEGVVHNFVIEALP